MRNALLVVMVGGVLASGVWAEDDAPIMVYPAPKAASPPKLDGRLDDPCWKDPPLVSGFTFFNSASVPDVQTAFRVTYDDQALYLAVLCDEPLAEKLKKAGPGSQDDFSAFRQECIELFVDPFHDHANYFQIAMSFQETLYDGRGMDTTWNSRTRVATSVGAKQWFLEAAVPWPDLGVKAVRPGMVLGLNVCRDRNLVEAHEWTNWSPMTGGFHNAPLFGHLVLSPTTAQLGALSGEFRKGNRQGPIRIFSSEGFTGAAYRELGRGALAELDRLLAELDKVAAQERPAVAEGLRQRMAEARRAIQPLREQLAGDQPVNAADWIRMDRLMTGLAQKLGQSLWEVRLEALLKEI